MTALVFISFAAPFSVAALVTGAFAQLRRFPGGRSAAFGADLREERRQLASARRTLRQVKRSLRQERGAAEGRIRAAETQHRARLRAAEHELDLLRRPGRGELLRAVGNLSIHQHAVVHGTYELPLDGLHARAETGARLLLIPARGSRRRVSFPAESGVDQPMVRSLVALIDLAAATERVFVQRRTEEIAEAEEALALLRADREELDSARQELATLLDAHETDPRLPAALRALERARTSWFTATGAWPR